ncbi:NAD+ synthase, partial [bacterium]
MPSIRIAMAQMNPIVGDIAGNAKKILNFTRMARAKGADLVLLPELALTGYPPEDLLLKPGFIDDNLAGIKKLARAVRGIVAVVGFVDFKGGLAYNSAAIINNGKIIDVYCKMFLPNYGVFDEKRYFKAGNTALNFILNNITIGVGICEDIWFTHGPARAQAKAGADVIVNINASPFHVNKEIQREEMLVKRALDNRVTIAYNNMTGAQDELVFDGHGMIIGSTGAVVARGKAFEEDLIVADIA